MKSVFPGAFDQDQWCNTQKNVSGAHDLPVRGFVFGPQWVSAYAVTCSLELIIEQEEGGFPFSTAPRPEYCSRLCLPPGYLFSLLSTNEVFQELPSSLEHVYTEDSLLASLCLEKTLTLCKKKR